VFDGATGVGLLDRTIIDALQRLGASSHGRPVRAAALLYDLDGVGLPPRSTYRHLCLSTQRSLCWLRPYRPIGNAGSRVDPPAGPGYVQMSLSEVGDLLAEPDTAAVPLGFVNGNMHVDGLRPAFDPVRVLDAVLLATSRPDVPDAELVELLGRPSFPAGCVVEGDVEALHRGDAVTLTLTARLEPDPAGTQLLMTGVPPVADPHEVLRSLADRATPPRRPPGASLLAETLLPLAAVDDRSGPDGELYVLTPRSDVTLDDLRSKVLTIWGVTTAVRAQLPASTATVVRHHATVARRSATTIERLRELVEAHQ
jgi:hypothetical protein